MKETYVLKWRQRRNPRQWFLRGLTTDGQFYGEVTLATPAGPLQVSISGTLPIERANRLRRILSSIQAATNRPDSVPFVGLLAKGPITDPNATVLLRYASGDEDGSEPAGKFLQLVRLLSPSISAQSREALAAAGRPGQTFRARIAKTRVA